MKIKSGILLISLSLFSFIVYSQSNDKSDSLFYRPIKSDILKPTIALGTGMFSFYGDISSNSLNQTLVNRIAYDLTLTKQIYSFLDINFYILFGKISANERTPVRNLNFQSEIRSGGVTFSYNFDHFLPKNRRITPYFTIGIEKFEFLSKTDLYDASGNKYFYWSDGSIRNMSENSSNTGNATILKRDYTYETDIRELNKDGFGKYNESSSAIPIGFGIQMKLSDRVNFKIGPTLHLSFSDYIDGITEKSIENRKGKKGNDKFIMTSFSLSYDLILNRAIPTNFEEGVPEEDSDNTDYLAIYMDDEDQDGVRDFIDQCPGTPKDVKVDKFGCPIDDDKDGVPNYIDDEFDTPKNVFVTTNGMELTDELINDMYRAYLGYIEPLDYTRTVQVKKETIYAVQLGIYKDGKVPEDVMDKFLNVPDLVSVNLPDNTTVYVVGEFKNPNNAESRKNVMVEYGINNAKIVELKKDKENNTIKVSDVDKSLLSQNQAPKTSANVNQKNYADVVLNSNKKEETNSFNSQSDEKREYRVMLGAYTKGIPSELINKFLKVPNIISDKINDSITVFSIGHYDILPNAVDKMNEIVKGGIVEAKVIEYKKNKYVPVSQEQLITLKGKYASSLKNEIGKEEIDLLEYYDESFTNLDPRNIVVFRVQLGAYKKKLSRNIFKGITGVVELTTEDKLTKYLTGSFTQYNDAAKHKVDMVIKGFGDAFIVAYKNGKRVPLNSVGATSITSENMDESKVFNAINKNLITYKIEIGIFPGDLPPDIVKSLGPLLLDIQKQITMKGLKRYTLGSFNDYISASIYKNQITKQYGLSKVKITAFFKDDEIPLQEALELTE